MEVSTEPNLAAQAPAFDDLPVKRMKQLVVELQTLENHPGWAYIVQVLISQAHNRFESVGRSQAYEVRDMVIQAGLRGEADALEQLASYPSFLRNMLIAQLSQRGIEVTSEDDEDAD